MPVYKPRGEYVVEKTGSASGTQGGRRCNDGNALAAKLVASFNSSDSTKRTEG